jgi:ADP-ribose pyrophosphatase YjhB (NUDIX family)
MYAFRFCPDCGARLPEPEPAEHVLSQTCETCKAIHWRNAKPCAGALVVRDGRVLLGRRAVDPARGAWDIPGGFLEPWELPQHAAVREVLEETGLVVRAQDNPFTVVIDTYADRDYTLNLYYLAEIVGGSAGPADDLTELGWFAPDELPGDLAFAHCAEVLARWRCANS